MDGKYIDRRMQVKILTIDEFLEDKNIIYCKYYTDSEKENHHCMFPQNFHVYLTSVYKSQTCPTPCVLTSNGKLPILDWMTKVAIYNDDRLVFLDDDEFAKRYMPSEAEYRLVVKDKNRYVWLISRDLEDLEPNDKLNIISTIKNVLIRMD
jgi:hypothetical protein